MYRLDGRSENSKCRIYEYKLDWDVEKMFQSINIIASRSYDNNVCTAFGIIDFMDGPILCVEDIKRKLYYIKTAISMKIIAIICTSTH